METAATPLVSAYRHRFIYRNINDADMHHNKAVMRQALYALHTVMTASPCAEDSPTMLPPENASTSLL